MKSVVLLFFTVVFFVLWKQGWHSGESARLPPMWPGFDSRTGRYMRVEFVVCSVLDPRDFSLGTPVFPSPQNPVFLNSNSIWNLRATDYVCQSHDCQVLPSSNKDDLLLTWYMVFNPQLRQETTVARQFCRVLH